jgi:hypothetical protein
MISAGYETMQFVQEDGTVWFSGENSTHEGADFSVLDRTVPTQTGLTNFYSLIIGRARIYQSDNLTEPVAPSNTWVKMPRSVTIYDTQYLYIEENDLIEAFWSQFNLLTPEFERPLPRPTVVLLLL